MNVITQFPAAYEYDHDLRFRALFEGAAIGIGICRLDGQIFEANAALTRMLGYSQPELLRARAEELYPDLRRDSNKDNGKDNGNDNGNGNDEGESKARQIYSGTLSLDQRLLAELMRGERDSFDAERPFRRKDGSHLWGHLTVSLGRDDRRQPAFLIATLTDATERRQVEEHLREAEKMEVIGRLAGGIAHDFNNLLTGILLYCDLLSAGLENSATHNGKSHPSDKEQAEPCELCHHVEEVRRAGEQGAAITQQLLSIARKQAAEPRPVVINEIVASTQNLLRRLIGEQVELVLELDPSLNPTTEPSADPAGLVLADPAQLRQVLMNLVLNARDAMPQGGRITISTRRTEFPDVIHYDARENGVPRGSHRAISMVVTDNGCGMAPEICARLFEPFFTTKKPGEGTGLGLATVQRIVSESGGSIAVESDPRSGTRIEIALPAVASSPNVSSSNVPAIAGFEEKSAQKSPNDVNSQESQKNRGEHHQTSCKTILLVDDNAPARQSMGRILLDAGYQILEASNGKQALMLTEQAGAPDLLIADCMMPTMSGQEIAEALLRKHNQLKVLLISGFESPPLGSAAAAVEMIRKPFSGTTLLDRVLEVLGS
jgi:signal transduction histidine kinase/CheY-like chemotaxis protein